MKKLVLIIIVVAAVLGLTFVLKPRQEGISTVQESSDLAADRTPVIKEDYVKYYGAEGRTAFELLREITQVEYQESQGLGVFVQSINGVKPDEKHFWKLFINGEEAQVGADSLQTKNNDVIEWKVEQINN